MMIKMRTLALRSESIAHTSKSQAARERAQDRSDAASWWYFRDVELLCFRGEVIGQLQMQAEAVAQAEQDRGYRERAESRRWVDRRVLAGFVKERGSR